MAADRTDEADEAALVAYVDALALVQNLAIEPDWRPTVLANMKTITQAARLVMAYPLDDLDEAAPVFSA